MTRDEYLIKYGNCVRSAVRVVVLREDDTEVLPGDTIRTRGGDEYKLRNATRFRSSEMGKSGKLLVHARGCSRELYDHVFDLRVEAMF